MKSYKDFDPYEDIETRMSNIETRMMNETRISKISGDFLSGRRTEQERVGLLGLIPTRPGSLG